MVHEEVTSTKCPLCLKTLYNQNDIDKHYIMELNLYEQSSSLTLEEEQHLRRTSTTRRAKKNTFILAHSNDDNNSITQIKKPTAITKKIDQLDKSLAKLKSNRIKKSKQFLLSFHPSLIDSITSTTGTVNKHFSTLEQQLLQEFTSAQENSSVHESNPICPICSMSLPMDDESVNMHIDMCLNNPIKDHQDQINSQFILASSSSTTLTSADSTAIHASHHISSLTSTIKPAYNNYIPNESKSSSLLSSNHAPNLTHNNRHNEWEEYTWAGETRVRATALMESKFSAAGYIVRKNTDEDETEEPIDIDDDDASTFGEAQYTEKDLRLFSFENKILSYLETEDDINIQQESIPCRQEEMINNSSLIPHEEDEEEEEIDIIDDHHTLPDEVSFSLSSAKQGLAGDSKLIIYSLKKKIKSLEATNSSNTSCLICMDSFKNPVVSTICWHVHCEKCWLQTLAAKKLCPQCQKITCTSDLRKIYL